MSESQERPYCFAVREGDDARLLCNQCAQGYVGEGGVMQLDQDVVGDVAICSGCGADLHNPEEVGR